MGLLWGSAGLSAIVDNIPLVATISPVVADLVQAEGGRRAGRIPVVVTGIGRRPRSNATADAGLGQRGDPRPGRRRHKITFWGFTKYGLVVALATLAVCTPYLMLRYFVFA